MYMMIKVKYITLVVVLLFCKFAVAQNNIANVPTTALYGYYQSGQNFKSIQPKIKEYESLMAMMQYSFTKGNVNADYDYTLLWKYKFKAGGDISAQIRYQFLIPFFKITVQHIIASYPNGNMQVITPNSTDPLVSKMYADLYATFVTQLINQIKPAKTLTREQLQKEFKK